MANYRTRSVNYTPRMTPWQALEAMPEALRNRVNAGWFLWDPYSILRQYLKWAQVQGKERALNSTIQWLNAADEREAEKPWKDFHNHKIPSPTVWVKVVSTNLEDLLVD